MFRETVGSIPLCCVRYPDDGEWWESDNIRSRSLEAMRSYLKEGTFKTRKQVDKYIEIT